jgi:hypothetical protein
MHNHASFSYSFCSRSRGWLHDLRGSSGCGWLALDGYSWEGRAFSQRQEELHLDRPGGRNGPQTVAECRETSLYCCVQEGGNRSILSENPSHGSKRLHASAERPLPESMRLYHESCKECHLSTRRPPASSPASDVTPRSTGCSAEPCTPGSPRKMQAIEENPG